MQYQQTAWKVLGIWLAIFLTGLSLFLFYPKSSSPNHLAGIQYQKILMKTLTLVSAHQSLATRGPVLSKKSSGSMLTLQTAIDASFDQLLFLYEKSLRFDLPEDVAATITDASLQNVLGLKQEWANLKEQRHRLDPSEISILHRQMMKRLRVEAVRTAQLFDLQKHMHPGDSDLMRLVTQTIPEIYEHMSHVKALVPKQQWTDADRSQVTKAVQDLEKVSSESLAEFEAPLRDFIAESKKIVASERNIDPAKTGSVLFTSEKSLQELQMKGLETIAQNMKLFQDLQRE